MAEDTLQSLKALMSEFGDMSLNDFRDAFQSLVKDSNPTIDRFILEEMKNWSSNRTMRAVFAAALGEREDENYLEDFVQVIEKETDVGLCKECINGLVRIGTQEAIQKLEYLAANKPNANIVSLLKRELDKLTQEKKNPVSYYLDHIAQGNKNPRNCIHASKVLIKIGTPEVVDQILEAFDGYDDLSRTEGSKVVAQLGVGRHLDATLNILETYTKAFAQNEAFVDILDDLGDSKKEVRLPRLRELVMKTATEDQQPFAQQFLDALEKHAMNNAKALKDQLLDMAQPIGLDYYLESCFQISDNKLASANKTHEDAIRNTRVRHSRLRHLLAELAYGIGKIAGNHAEAISEESRKKTVDWLCKLIVASDSDICKQALYGAAFLAKPTDETLLMMTLKSHSLEGMTRFLNALERRSSTDFADFFLTVSMKHEILDIQEMAMQSMGSTPSIMPKLKKLIEDPTPDTRCMGIRIIGAVKASQFQEDLLALLEGQSDIIRMEAITALGKFGDPDLLKHIDEVMVDAKSPTLIDTSLKAIAMVGGAEAVALLKEYAEKARNKRTSIIAVQLLVDSFRSWSNPLPDDCHQLVLSKLQEWFEDRSSEVRQDVYKIGAAVITISLELYTQLKDTFKGASTRLRKEANWDKAEMQAVDSAVKSLNRNFFFLKEMLEFHKDISGRCRNHDNPSSTTRVNVYEKLISGLENNQRFILSQENIENLERVYFTGLELGEASWREQSLIFQIANFFRSETVLEDLQARVKRVPKQAKGALLDALTSQGMDLHQVNDLTAANKLLVVEGSGFYRKRLVKYLEKAKFKVRDTSDPELAEAMIRNELPDCVITELMFDTPETGLSFLEKIGKEFAGKLFFIVSTNVRDTSILDRVGKLNPKKVMHKPYPLEDLETAIRATE
jgi:HEAT repeat protein